MKTKREFLELLAESEMVQYGDISRQLESLKDQMLTSFILNRCSDGDNVLDYLALAIDQRGKEDGIALIEEIWQKLEDGEDTPTQEDWDDEKPLSKNDHEILAQTQSLKLDAQAAHHYLILEKDPNVEESADWLEKYGYPINAIDFIDPYGEPICANGSIWKSPDFNWKKWYEEKLGWNKPKISRYQNNLNQELQEALEDAIDQLHHLDSGKPGDKIPLNELRYTTRNSIRKLRTQLERLFPTSKFIEKYKEVDLD